MFSKHISIQLDPSTGLLLISNGTIRKLNICVNFTLMCKFHVILTGTYKYYRNLWWMIEMENFELLRETSWKFLNVFSNEKLSRKLPRKITTFMLTEVRVKKIRFWEKKNSFMAFTVRYSKLKYWWSGDLHIKSALTQIYFSMEAT